jgi:excinuclease ABC subunit C
VERLPEAPGVYLMRDTTGRLVYVGKARRLRQRVRQYFSGHDDRPFVAGLAELLGDLEFIVTSSDKEALLLENHLVKEHQPRFNVQLRDDKNYLMLRLDSTRQWPRLELVRRPGTDGADYFGPYHSAASARSTLRTVNRHFRLRTCTDYALRHRTRPCLQYQIGRCPAPCVLAVDSDEYAAQVRDAGLFLAGRRTALLGSLQTRMEHAAQALEFETAARLRDQVAAISVTLAQQHIIAPESDDCDAVGMFREGGQTDFVVIRVRDGTVSGSDACSHSGLEFPDPEALAGFLGAYYGEGRSVPPTIWLPGELQAEDGEVIAAWLAERAGHDVRLRAARRGAAVHLVALAQRNAAAHFSARRDRTEDAERALERLRTRLGLSRLPRRIECIDVSHLQGVEPVASLVVFVDAQPAKELYRSFKIRGSTADATGPTLAQGDRQNDDFASMYEVVARRLQRGLDSDDEAWALPDLLVLDGGRGQLAQALTAMQDLGIPQGLEGFDVVALAKERVDGPARDAATLARLRDRREDGPVGAPEGALREKPAIPAERGAQAAEPGEAYAALVAADVAQTPAPEHTRVRPERVFVPGTKEALSLRAGSSERHLLERIRDEAHRFAISHNRRRRTKKALTGALDEIAGVGPKLRRELLRHFGSVKAMGTASEEELTAVPGVGKALARRIAQSLRSGPTAAQTGASSRE